MTKPYSRHSEADRIRFAEVLNRLEGRVMGTSRSIDMIAQTLQSITQGNASAPSVTHVNAGLSESTKAVDLALQHHMDNKQPAYVSSGFEDYSTDTPGSTLRRIGEMLGP